MALSLFREAVIPAGQGVSNWLRIDSDLIGAVSFPSELTGTTQIVLEHAWVEDGTGGGPLIIWPDTVPLVIPFTALATVMLPVDSWATLGFLRVVAGTSGSPVVQAADRSFNFGRRA